MKPKPVSLKLDTTVQVTDADIQSPRHQVPDEYGNLQVKLVDLENEASSESNEGTEDSQPEIKNIQGKDVKFKPRELSTVQHNDELTVQPILHDHTPPVQVPAELITVSEEPSRAKPKIEETNTPIPNLITQVSKEQPLVAPVIQKPKRSFWSRLRCCAVKEELPFKKPAPPLAIPPVKPESNSTKKLLPPPKTTKKCLVLDLDETLVHSSFKPVEQSDFTIQVDIENHVYTVFVLKRPGVEEFLKQVAEWFEIVVFTASLAKYADPVLDRLDQDRTISHRLFRESCVQYRGNYVKDLSQLGRDLNSAAIVDNSPICYMFHPNNAVPITSWFDDPEDRELEKLLPYLEKMARSDEIPKFITTVPRDL